MTRAGRDSISEAQGPKEANYVWLSNVFSAGADLGAMIAPAFAPITALVAMLGALVQLHAPVLAGKVG